MGVKTEITLKEAQKLFSEFHLTQLTATKEGVMDTTYVAKSDAKEYILKKYERDLGKKIIFDAELLALLHHKGLNVPLLLAQNREWYLYTKLQGSEPRTIRYPHIQALGRFLAKLHNQTAQLKTSEAFLEHYRLTKELREIKSKHYFYYKKLASLHRLTQLCDGFIHGDIFKDNTLFEGNKIAVFDFIDGGCGSFAFELGVVMLSFNPNSRKSYKRVLLKSYNQNAPKRVTLQELEENIQNAAKLYALLRISHHSNTNRAKELLKFW
jgi:homoserine kinase type II